VFVNDEMNEVATRAFESVLAYVKRNPDLGLVLGRVDNVTVNATDPQFLLDTRKDFYLFSLNWVSLGMQPGQLG